MNKLIQELQNVLPKGMNIPKPLEMLYEWIEENNLYVDIENTRYGFLYPEEQLKESWTEEGRDGGTSIEIAASGSQSLENWFDSKDPEIKARLCVFAQSGADGSTCALWLDNNNEIKIVHMGSGSGSTLECILGDALDFIRLLAIGYYEVCWDEEYPNKPSENEEFLVKPNIKFQEWVKETFNVSIPETALEIVKHPATMDDEESEDEFFNWCMKFRS